MKEEAAHRRPMKLVALGRERSKAWRPLAAFLSRFTITLAAFVGLGAYVTAMDD